MNKKAVFFSLGSLLVIGVLVVAFNADANMRSSDDVVLQLQDFSMDSQRLSQQYLPEILRAFTRSALDDIALENINRLNDQEAMLDTDAEISACLGTKHTQNCRSQETHRLRFAIDRLEEALEKQQYSAGIQLIDIDVVQIGAWTLVADGQFAVSMNNSLGDTRQTKMVPVQVQIPIEGLIDPVSSYQRGEIHRIKRTPRSEDIEFFYEHARKRSYVPNPSAPSYMDRLSGLDVQAPETASDYGISSLVLQDGQQEEYSQDYGDRSINGECRYIINIPGINEKAVLPASLIDDYDIEGLLEDNSSYSTQDCGLND